MDFASLLSKISLIKNVYPEVIKTVKALKFFALIKMLSIGFNIALDHVFVSGWIGNTYLVIINM